MKRNKWLWIFVIFLILNLIFFSITMYNVLEIEILYVNIIRALLVILAVIALIQALLTKK